VPKITAIEPAATIARTKSKNDVRLDIAQAKKRASALARGYQRPDLSATEVTSAFKQSSPNDLFIASNFTADLSTKLSTGIFGLKLGKS
jgi:hypothetical protein